VPARILGGLIGAFVGAHLALCVLVLSEPIRDAGIIKIMIWSATAGFAFGAWILGNRLTVILATRHPTGHRPPSQQVRGPASWPEGRSTASGFCPGPW
jgi:hypothetical protein